MNDMTTTAQDTVKAGSTKAATPDDAQAVAVKKRNDEFRQRIDSCKQYRRRLIPNWTISIDYRRGKPFTSQTDDDQVSVNLDWTLTKAKQALLFSQVPKVRINHPPQSLQAKWTSTFEQKLNDNLILAGVESTMDEVLPDVINAAGIGIALVSYESIAEDVTVPKKDPTTLEPGEEPEQDTVPRIVDYRYVVERISPADFLWNISFNRSDFDRSPFVGRSGRITWASAIQKWPLKPEDKSTVLGEDRPVMDKLTHDVDRDKTTADEMVNFDEIFWRENQYDVNSKSFDTIRHLVFVQGKDDPVVDEPWKGQKIGPDGKVQGAKKFPIRVLTLTYITDEAIPPSDSAIGRPQVNELNKARTQMIQQRQRSLPVRWGDVNRLDPAIMQSLMRGTWQAFIPTQGDGQRVIGEVARATMPQENFLFDKIAKSDLNEVWTVGTGVDPTNISSDRPDQPSPLIQAREGRERAKAASFFVSIAEVLGGLMCLYEDPSSLGDGFDPSFSSALSYSILADSTVLLDSNQRLKRLNDFVNQYAKSGWVNLEPVMKEAATLVGLDPSIVIQAPQPKPPVEPNISLRLTGLEDLLNPLTLAFMMKSGQAPDAKLIEQAKQLIQQAVVPPQPPPGAQQGPQGPPQGQPIGPPSPAPPPGSPLPQPPPHKVGEANPQMTSMAQVNNRTESGGKQ